MLCDEVPGYTCQTHPSATEESVKAVNLVEKQQWALTEGAAVKWYVDNLYLGSRIWSISVPKDKWEKKLHERIASEYMQWF